MKKNVITIILVSFAMGVFCPRPGRAATMNVISFGARGDAIQTFASTTRNSTQVTLASTNRLSTADVGKLIELFGVGPATSPTNNQDLIATIVSVRSSTRVTISRPVSVTAVKVNCTYGTQNAVAFQNCVDACPAGNNLVTIPAGTYLIVPPQILSTNFEMDGSSTLAPAITLSKGGIEFLGDTPNDTVLLGNGAWIINNGFVQRGVIFGCMGPVTNNYPLRFQNLCFDGGVQVGNLNYGTGPADPVTGGGWDITHDAVVDRGEPPYHTNKFFVNCNFQHWRGEMVKSVVAWTVGFIAMTNCAFCDGDGSGFNFNWTPHVINGCLFSNLNMAIEFYVGTMQTNCLFENCVVTNTRIAITLVGALTNAPSPGYKIFNNSISALADGIMLGPARNVQVIGNTFYNARRGLMTDDAAYQGNDINSDILVESNRFVNVGFPLAPCGDGPDRMANVIVDSNTAYGCANFASGYGWSSNVVFVGNASLQPVANHLGQLDSSQLEGQCFIDSDSNNFNWWDVNFSRVVETNIASYVFGQRQQLNTDNPLSVCILDSTDSPTIPHGAELMITNASVYPIILYSSSSRPLGIPVILPARGCFTYVWSNGMWNR
jgi:hypothetical protein